MWRYFVPALVFAAVVAFLVAGLGKDPSYVPSPLIGKPAPEFSLPRLDDPARTLSRADLLGHTSVVNVWGTWCTGCRQEHDTLMEIAREDLVPIYGLNWKDDLTLARQWLATLGDPYEVTGVDQEGSVAIDWGVYGAPETFLVAPDGTVVYKHIAPLTMEIWRREFVPRIQELAGR